MTMKTTQRGEGGGVSQLPPLTEIVDAADKISKAFGTSNPIDAAIRRDAYKLYDILFGADPGTTQRIYNLRQTEKRWAA